MNDLNELQDIWKSGTNNVKTSPGNYMPGSMIQKLKKLESLQSRVNKFKILVLLFAFGLISYSLSTLSHNSYQVYLGFGILIIATVYFMVIYLKSQFNIKRLDFTADSLAFAESAIQMLEKQNSIFNVPFRVFALLLMVGANIMLLGLDLESEDHFMLHINITFFIAVSALIGLRIRMWRIRKEVDPIIADLKAIKESLKS